MSTKAKPPGWAPCPLLSPLKSPTGRNAWIESLQQSGVPYRPRQPLLLWLAVHLPQRPVNVQSVDPPRLTNEIRCTHFWFGVRERPSTHPSTPMPNGESLSYESKCQMSFNAFVWVSSLFSAVNLGPKQTSLHTASLVGRGPTGRRLSVNSGTARPIKLKSSRAISAWGSPWWERYVMHWSASSCSSDVATVIGVQTVGSQ